MKTSINRAELKQLIQTRKDVLVIDVRSQEEYNEKHIHFAENVPLEIIESGDFIPVRGKIIITACGKGGGRSERTAKFLRENNHQEAYFLEDGTFGWIENEQ
jgi:rhodanese-related sulfurtransferase